jgi:hypothetical protein
MSGQEHKAYFQDIGYWIEAEIGKSHSSLESRFMQVGEHALQWSGTQPRPAQIDG